MHNDLNLDLYVIDVDALSLSTIALGRHLLYNHVLLVSLWKNRR